MNREGFWYSAREPELPMPVANNQAWEGEADFIKKLEEIQAEVGKVSFRGFSICRICNKANGSSEYYGEHRGNWIWPSGFLHYVEAHHVKPSEEFRKFVCG